MAHVLLLGLDDASAAAISKLSIQTGHAPEREPMRTTFETLPETSVIFVSADQNSYLAVIRAIRQFRNAPPVVVISRLGDTSSWLDALEAGAADFCAAPYNLLQIGGVIEAAITRPKAFAA